MDYKRKDGATSGLSAVFVSSAAIYGDLCLQHTPVTEKHNKPVCAHTVFLIPVFYRMFLAPHVPCLCALNKSLQTVAHKFKIVLDTATVSTETNFFLREMLLRDAFKRLQAIHLVFQRNKH